jgi:hypothetical protein
MELELESKKQRYKLELVSKNIDSNMWKTTDQTWANSTPYKRANRLDFH